jgi:hypothetical protein
MPPDLRFGCENGWERNGKNAFKFQKPSILGSPILNQTHLHMVQVAKRKGIGFLGSSFHKSTPMGVAKASNIKQRPNKSQQDGKFKLFFIVPGP